MPVALLTDFGTRDYFVGAMKGVILSINRKAVIVDITHEIERHNILKGAFTLAACFRDFPEGTIFVCVVDPGVGSSRRAIAAEVGGRKFVGPDNGLVSFVSASAEEPMRCYDLVDPRFHRPRVGATFHGRDIFAPVAAHLSLGVPIAEVGRLMTDPVLLKPSQLRREGRSIFGEVLHIDHFGNIVTNIPSDESLSGGIVNSISVSRVESNYTDSPSHVPFFIKGSAGFWEVSLREASAAELFSVSAGDAVTGQLSRC